MGRRIHTRIFFPMLTVIILLSFASWLIFSMTSGWYARHTTEKNVTELMDVVEKHAAEIYRLSEQARTKDEEQQDSRELLSRMKAELKAGHRDAGLMVLNSKLKQVYTDRGDELLDMRVYQLCAEMLDSGTLSAGIMTELKAGGETCLVQMFETEADHNVRAKYLIAYARIPDMTLLLSFAGNLIVMIAAVCLLLGGIAVWLVVGSISRPLEELCRQTDRIGDGSYSPISADYGLWELEKLKDAYNRMETRLKHEEERNVRFFQNVSHDLRTPLVAITGYAQGLQCGVMKDTGKAAGIILSESLRMTNLVESILTISKMDSHELKLHLVMVDLEEFLEEQVEILQAIADNKELILLENDMEITAKADPDLLVRMIQNIISNCIRYAESRVEVRVAVEEDWAVVMVEDDGPGFSEEDAPHVFERFYRGERGKFGIGLSVVWSGAQYMGGKVEVGSREQPLHGAVYRLYLPKE